MNDEYTPRDGADADDAPARSRWTVAPGSVRSAFDRRSERASQAPVESAGDPDAVTPRRSAREIIDDATKAPFRDDQPTRISSRRPQVPKAAHPPLRRPSTEPPAHTAGRVQRAARAPLHDESTRVEPELGQRRELTPLTSSSSSGGGVVLAGFGGVVLIIVLGLVGAIIDYLFTDRLGLLTTVGLTVGAALAALATRKRDLMSVMVAPPLVYAGIASVVLLMSGEVRLTRVADMAIRGFPVMALATGVAAVIAGIRLITSKVGERP
ncbi:DUF6542 domain-containing protein [Blastococcus sp. Marseille-P5729]|uniref:DUF6542 domain-containing protein n=1 Tax=Blastococcus sp. Marseille-P5729 TaxID=2086582 RepID=UPI000D0F5147|nr:DUF6542 domain-containing protein [Blastococcus sp. Marseille-P5729]